MNLGPFPIDMGYRFEECSIPGVVLVTPEVYEDDRGFFIETFSVEAFSEKGIDMSCERQGHSLSRHGVIRGLHFQMEPHGEALLVRCVRGEIFDVIVDLRRSSPSFGDYVSNILSAANNEMVHVPTGCAHGYAVLSDEAEVIYTMDSPYKPNFESGIRWDDPTVNIDWPIDDPLVSNTDSELQYLSDLGSSGALFD